MNNTYGKEFEDAKKTLDMLQAHPMTKALQAEKVAKVLKERQATAGRIEALKQDEDIILPGLQDSVTALQEELQAHDQARKVIQGKLSQAAASLMVEKQRISLEKAGAERELIESADPKIDEAIQFFRDEFEALRRKSVHKDQRLGKVNAFTLRREITVYSNYRALNAGLGYCRTAINELESMKMMPSADLGRIEALKEGIPDINQMTEITSDKPLPAGPESVNPLHLLPTDSEMDWQINKLFERCKRLIGC